MSAKEIMNHPQMQLVIRVVELREVFFEMHEEIRKNLKKEEAEVYLSPDEVCIQYKVSKTTLWRNCRNGLWPPPIKVGRKSLFPKSKVDAVLGPNRRRIR